jgi:hypothetical protein
MSPLQPGDDDRDQAEQVIGKLKERDRGISSISAAAGW